MSDAAANKDPSLPAPSLAGPRWPLALAALAALLVVTSAPALRGSWVYDDWMIVTNPALHDPKELLRTFARNSGDYLQQRLGTSGLPDNPTYRPLPMWSFVAVSVLFGEAAWPHHALSLALHLAALFLLFRLAARRGRIAWPALYLIALFALHPALGEAWLWINGRSDVMAGVALLGAAWVLRGASENRRSPLAETLKLLPIFFAGLLCKETFLVAAAGLVCAGLIEDGAALHCLSWRERLRRLAMRARRSLPSALALALSATAFFSARAATLHGGGAALGGLGDFRFANFFARAPRLIALAIEALVVPLPRSMRLLAWELFQPWTAAHFLLLFALLGLLVLLWLRGARRAVVLLLTAVATVLPTYLVSASMWLGFDRYLYLPACLVLIAALPAASDDRLEHLVGRTPIRIALALSLLLLALAQRGVANCYRSHQAWALSMIDLRPDEPTGYDLAASAALSDGEPAVANAMMDRLPLKNLPPPMVNAVTGLFVRLHRTAEAIAVQEDANARHPDDLQLQFELFFLRGGQRRWLDALDLGDKLARDPVRGAAVHDQIRQWLNAAPLPPELRPRFEKLAVDPR